MWVIVLFTLLDIYGFLKKWTVWQAKKTKQTFLQIKQLLQRKEKNSGNCIEML